MKKFLTLVLCLSIIHLTNGQDYANNEARFEGEWFGLIYDDEGEQTNYLRLTVNYDGSYFIPYSYGYDSDTEEWYEREFIFEDFNVNRNNAQYTWMNYGGVWSETQTYFLSMVNNNEIEMIWVRQVNNEQENGNNEVWSVQGTGTLERVGGGRVYTNPFVGGRSNQNINIDMIEVTDEYTIVTFTYDNSGSTTMTMRLYEPGKKGAYYLTTSDRSSNFELIKKDGITYYPEDTTLPAGESITFVCYFEPLPDDIEVITILEGLPEVQSGNEWNFYDVKLK
jgi:hypothetical protein